MSEKWRRFGAARSSPRPRPRWRPTSTSTVDTHHDGCRRTDQHQQARIGPRRRPASTGTAAPRRRRSSPATPWRCSLTVRRRPARGRSAASTRSPSGGCRPTPPPTCRTELDQPSPRLDALRRRERNREARECDGAHVHGGPSTERRTADCAFPFAAACSRRIVRLRRRIVTRREGRRGMPAAAGLLGCRVRSMGGESCGFNGGVSRL